MRTFNFSWNDSPPSVLVPPFSGIALTLIGGFLLIRFGITDVLTLAIIFAIFLFVIPVLLSAILNRKSKRVIKNIFNPFLSNNYPTLEFDKNQRRALLYGLPIQESSTADYYRVLSNGEQAILISAETRKELEDVDVPEGYVTRKTLIPESSIIDDEETNLPR